MKTSPERITQEQVVEAPQTNLVLPKSFVGRIIKGVTTPNVNNVENWVVHNTAPVTITDFLDAQEGQNLYILGDGQTTLQHGTKIFLVGGVNLLLLNNVVYHLVKYPGKWVQVS